MVLPKDVGTPPTAWDLFGGTRALRNEKNKSKGEIENCDENFEKCGSRFEFQKDEKKKDKDSNTPQVLG